MNDGWQVVTEGGYFSDNAVRPLQNDGSGGIAELSLTMDTIRGAYFFLNLNSSMDPQDIQEKLEIFLDDNLGYSLPAPTGRYIQLGFTLPPGRSTVMLRYHYSDSGNGDVLVDNIGMCIHPLSMAQFLQVIDFFCVTFAFCRYQSHLF